MSLTEAETVFAGLHEGGVDDLLRAFFTARPRHLNYGTATFVSLPPGPGAWTTIPPITFPGVPGGIHYAVQFEVPVVDLHPDSTGGMPPPLSLLAERFSLATKVTLSLLCGERRKDREDEEEVPAGSTLRASLELWAVGKITAQYFGPGTGEIGFEVEAVEIVDISPDRLESLLECLIKTLLQAALSGVRLPFRAVSAGAFTLILLRGPETEDDQVKVYGDV